MAATSLANGAAGSSTQACSNAGADIISRMPPNVAQHILERVPFCDAVRTSVLSRHWRYKWTTISHIKLNPLFFHNFQNHEPTESSEFPYSYVINNILLSHVGPIHTFDLSMTSCFNLNELHISHWVQCLSGKGVKDLNLTDSIFSIIRIPSCLFFCTTLTHLTLKNCKVKSLPPTFSGFPLLTNLDLLMPKPRVPGIPSREKDVVQNLISSCPRLKSLNLHDFEGENLVIHAPELQELWVYGLFYDLLLEGTTHVTTLDLRVSCVVENDLCLWLSCIPNIRKLVLSDIFWPPNEHRLQCNNQSLDLPEIKFEQLVSLELLQVSFDCRQIFNNFLYLIENSPNLQHLRCDARMQEYCYCELFKITESSTFPSLKQIELKILGIKNDLEVIKYLLASSPALEKMTVVLKSSCSSTSEVKMLDIAKELMRFRRASTAEIIFKT